MLLDYNLEAGVPKRGGGWFCSKIVIELATFGFDQLPPDEYKRITNRRMVLGRHRECRAHPRTTLDVGSVDNTRLGLAASHVSERGTYVPSLDDTVL
jgi:hypothetical protein